MVVGIAASIDEQPATGRPALTTRTPGPGERTEATNLLVLLMGDDPGARVHEGIAGRQGPPARIRVVAPALVGPLDWLATADDASHDQAEKRALAMMQTLTGTAAVEGGAGDADPIQAVEDALRVFPADMIVIAGDAADPDLEAGLERFDLPVSRLQPPPRGPHARAFRALRSLAGGRNSAAPFVLFAGVNLFFLLTGLFLSAFVLLVLWVAGAL